MPIHILRERNRRSGATVLQRCIDQTMPTKDRGPWGRSLNNFMPLYGNRLTDFTLSALYAMQRFIIMAGETDTREFCGINHTAGHLQVP